MAKIKLMIHNAFYLTATRGASIGRCTFFLFGYVLVLVWFCALGTVNAQSNFQPGYIIDVNGDTIVGWIDQKDWHNNPRKIAFKKDEKQLEDTYNPMQIKAFSVLGESYESAIVSTCLDPVSTNRITRFPEFTLVVDTVFLRGVISGEKSLFHAKNIHNIDNYYIKIANGFELLRFKKYLKVNESGYRTAENRSYLLQLQSYLDDCPSIAPHIPSVKYNLESISNLFRVYNECTDSEAEYQKEKKFVALETGACLGGTSTLIGFRSSNSVFNFLTRADFAKSYDLAGGFFLNVVQNKSGGQWAFCNDLLYSSFRTNGQYLDFKSEDHYTSHKTELAYSYVKLNNMLQYRMPIGKVRISLSGGFSFGFLMRQHNLRTKDVYFFNTQRITDDHPLERPPVIDPGHLYGIGIQLGRWAAELRREQSHGVSSIIQLAAPVQRSFLIIKYRFH